MRRRRGFEAGGEARVEIAGAQRVVGAEVVHAEGDATPEQRGQPDDAGAEQEVACCDGLMREATVDGDFTRSGDAGKEQGKQDAYEHFKSFGVRILELGCKQDEEHGGEGDLPESDGRCAAKREEERSMRTSRAGYVEVQRITRGLDARGIHGLDVRGAEIRSAGG